MASLNQKASLKRVSKVISQLSARKTAALYDSTKDDLTKSKYEIDPKKDVIFCPERTETRARNRFNDKVALATGGAGNFGAQFAERMASEGCNVAIVDIVDASDVAKNINNKYPNIKIKSYKVDITKEEDVRDVIEEIVREFGAINYLFNNAGYQGDFVPLHKYSVKDWRRVIDINVNGTFIVLKEVANQMKRQKNGGVVVQTASMAGVSAPPNMSAYATSKAAVRHLTKQAAKDLAPYNIRINSVSPAYIGPGYMWTRQIELQAKAGSIYYDKDPVLVKQQMINTPPLKRYGSIDEVIGVVTFLFSDDSSYLTGVDIEITGGIN